MQIIGRGLRIDPENDKRDCLVLDCAGAIFDCGDPMKERNYERKKPPKGSKKQKEPQEQISICRFCAHTMPTAERQVQVKEDEDVIETSYHCPYCGGEMSVSILHKREVELKRIQAETFEREQKTVRFDKMNDQYSGYKELQKLAKRAGYKTGWAWVTAQAITKARMWPFARQIFMRTDGMGLPPSEAIKEIRTAIDSKKNFSYSR
jgi:type I site-specific restriction endonuclease